MSKKSFECILYIILFLDFLLRSFRFNNKRPLKNLMIMGDKGCDINSPGIGDIAYVKDLQTEKIVTTSFRCSKFGVGHHLQSGTGWVGTTSFYLFNHARLEQKLVIQMSVSLIFIFSDNKYKNYNNQD